jgi:S-adenosylmethionine decarboxylase
MWARPSAWLRSTPSPALQLDLHPMTGLHLTADLWGCPADGAWMCDGKALAQACTALVARHGLTAVGQCVHQFAPRDEHPQAGLTGVWLLAESHLAVHTWPELGRVTLDVFVCNQTVDHSAAAQALLDALIQGFAPQRQQRQALRRGD